jgi:putative ABC transport system ATP-binding protein
MTIALVTHEPDIAAYAKRTVVFRDGKIVRDSNQRTDSGSGVRG